jgi:glucose/mannose-6-phosphate isomerase
MIAGERLDSLDMLGATLGLPEQVATAADELAGGIAGLPSGAISNVLAIGMGGSGIAGDVLAAIASPVCPVPILTLKDYELPGFVGPDTLVIAVSASGGTEETLSVTTEAAHAGAPLVVVCQGGALAELAQAVGAPWIPIPTSIVMPRAGIGALCVPPLIVLEELGLFPGARDAVGAAVTQLQRRRDQLARAGSEIDLLARRIGRTFPLIYGGGALGAVAAQRWKAQCNENAKVAAWANRVPELCHNEVAGWGQHGDVTRQVLTLIELRHDHEHPQIGRRFELVDNLVEEVVAGLYRVEAEGDGALAQLLDLVLFGDLVSLRLAFEAGVDPGPIPALDYIKQGLSP